jgi:hypothetical protein
MRTEDAGKIQVPISAPNNNKTRKEHWIVFMHIDSVSAITRSIILVVFWLVGWLVDWLVC